LKNRRKAANLVIIALVYRSTRYLFDEDIKHPSALQSEPEFVNRSPVLEFLNKIWGLGIGLHRAVVLARHHAPAYVAYARVGSQPP
jgi:hypothetical protein